jgi:hypothetical protein
MTKRFLTSSTKPFSLESQLFPIVLVDASSYFFQVGRYLS